MWKVAVVLSLLLASSAFGAVSLTMTPSNTNVAPDTPTSVTVAVNLATGGETVDGIGLYLATDTHGVSITNRTITSTKLTFKTYDDADIYAMNMFFDAADTSGLKDVGVGQTSPTTHATVDEQVMTLTFAIPALPMGTVVRVASPYAMYAGTGDGTIWGDGTSIQGSPVGFTVTVTPEPASMLLLAVGAAFFARRRRA